MYDSFVMISVKMLLFMKLTLLNHGTVRQQICRLLVKISKLPESTLAKEQFKSFYYNSKPIPSAIQIYMNQIWLQIAND